MAPSFHHPPSLPLIHLKFSLLAAHWNKYIVLMTEQAGKKKQFFPSSLKITQEALEWAEK